MTIFNSSIIPNSSSSGYEIDNSLRFDDNSQSNLYRTLGGSPTNSKKYTVSVWTKNVIDGADFFENVIYSTGGGGDNEDFFAMYDDSYSDGENTIRCTWEGDGTSGQGKNRRSYRTFTDPAAWYHWVVAWDSTQSVARDRLKIYCNGTLINDWRVDISEGRDPGLNQDFHWNNTDTQYVGRWRTSTGYWNGYMAEFHNIDGQQLTPADFGTTGDYGEWKPIEYTGTYGNNGFYLDFKTAGAGTTGAGADKSGNGNNFSTEGLSSVDQMLDTPTNNFAVLNSVKEGCINAFREGGLKIMDNASALGTPTIQPTSGKWYWEVDLDGRYSGSPYWGMCATDKTSDLSQSVNDATGFRIVSYNGYGNLLETGANLHGTIPLWPHDYIWGFAYDTDTGECWISRNGDFTLPLAGSNPSTGTSPCISGLPTGKCIPTFGSIGSSNPVFLAWVRANFGADSTFAGAQSSGGYADDNGYGDFKYSVPTGFLALCSNNLPDPAVKPQEHFNTVTYTGDGTTNNVITGVGFQPDLVWTKHINDGTLHQHNLFDVIRGPNKTIHSQSIEAEETITHGLSSFDSDGFTIGDNAAMNTNNINYASWNWKANGTGVSNTNGDITSTVSANADAGFSIVKYTGNGVTSAQTIGHGLSKAPEMIIKRWYNDDSAWYVYHTGLTSNYYELYLNDTDAQTAGGFFQRGMPNATTFTAYDGGETYQNIISYCFHSVDGYSKVGSYKGNGSNDGTFVYCGFRPAYIMLKESTASGENWQVYDNKRDIYNFTDHTLAPNSTAAEADGNGYQIDMLSNGFKIRYNNNQYNDPSSDYIYLAVAESPFKHTNAR